MLNLDQVTPADVDHIASLSNLEYLELGDCSNSSGFLLKSITRLKKLKSLRIEKTLLGNNLGELRWLSCLESLELIDVQLREGFGDGLVKMQTLKKLLIIPIYKDEASFSCCHVVTRS